MMPNEDRWNQNQECELVPWTEIERMPFCVAGSNNSIFILQSAKDIAKLTLLGAIGVLVELVEWHIENSCTGTSKYKYNVGSAV